MFWGIFSKLCPNVHSDLLNLMIFVDFEVIRQANCCLMCATHRCETATNWLASLAVKGLSCSDEFTIVNYSFSYFFSYKEMPLLDPWIFLWMRLEVCSQITKVKATLTLQISNTLENNISRAVVSCQVCFDSNSFSNDTVVLKMCWLCRFSLLKHVCVCVCEREGERWKQKRYM